MKFTAFFLVLGSLFLQSCASGPDLSNPEIREAVSKVQIFEKNDLKDRAFDNLGSLQAKVCQSNNFSSGNSSEEGAKTELRYEASKKGANGITNYLCHSKGLDIASNCNNVTICYADAVLVKH
ncbi:hypothetical protein ACJVC5_00195 [Peredibacter sp. HCB2-198]|uniref:hypothetical protein n=1 Tax=Peredibacter sp. HCB2-198 TaxID=3383025 RepID=UPI0038B64816